MEVEPTLYLHKDGNMCIIYTVYILYIHIYVYMLINMRMGNPVDRKNAGTPDRPTPAAETWRAA